MRRLRRLIKWVLACTWGVAILGVTFFNVRLYSPSLLATSQNQLPATLVAQLVANRSALESGAPSQMQERVGAQSPWRRLGKFS